MKVFSLFNGADTAGIGWRLAQAFARHGGPDWQFRNMAAATNYIDYPKDVPWDREELERLYDEADVVMIHHFMFGHDNYDFGQGKPTVLMHHGLKNGTVDTFASTVAECREAGITQVCSTLDMAIWEPELSWVPPAYEPAMLRGIREEYNRLRADNAPFRVVHAPTNREIKGTDLLLEAVRIIREDGYKLDLVMPEHQSWASTLPAIATADIAFDQPYLGHGCFAVEAWGMGLPVIAGVVDDQVRDGMREHWGTLPFFHVEPTIASIRDALMQLMEPFGRQLYGAIGSIHFDRYHAEERVVARLKPILEAAASRPSVPGGAARRLTLVGGGPIHPLLARQPIRGRQVNRIRR